MVCTDRDGVVSSLPCSGIGESPGARAFRGADKSRARGLTPAGAALSLHVRTKAPTVAGVTKRRFDGSGPAESKARGKARQAANSQGARTTPAPSSSAKRFLGSAKVPANAQRTSGRLWPAPATIASTGPGSSTRASEATQHREGAFSHLGAALGEVPGRR